MLYKVYCTPLAQKSVFFSGLLGLPYPSSGGETPPVGADFKTLMEYAKRNGLDGHSDEKALILPERIDTDEVDHLFHFIFNFQS